MKEISIKRFWKKVKKTPTCWIWTGARSRGYGYIQVNKIHILAHRFSYLLHNKFIDDKKTIDHLCLNKSCVNPAHLELVTFKENIWRRKSNKLNIKKADKIRQMYSFGKTQAELSIKFNIHQAHISKVINLKSWR